MTKEPPVTHPPYTLNEAAALLGRSTRTLRRWIHDGILQAELLPGQHGPEYHITAEQLEAVRQRVKLPTWSLALAEQAQLAQQLAALTQQVDALQEQIAILEQVTEQLAAASLPRRTRLRDRVTFSQARLRAARTRRSQEKRPNQHG